MTSLTDAELAAAVATIEAGASELARKIRELCASVWECDEFSLNACAYLYPDMPSVRVAPYGCSPDVHASVLVATRNALRVHHDAPPTENVFLAVYAAIVASARASGEF
jgi:hypothetical protein